MKKPTTEYRWEAYYPVGVGGRKNEEVFKRGPIRTDIDTVKKYADELTREIAELEFPPSQQKRHLAPYWRGARIRIFTRTISPWTELSRIDA